MQKQLLSSQNKKNSHFLSQKQKSTYLCLNPHCPTFSRLFFLEHSQTLTSSNLPHKQCSGWCVSTQQLKTFTSSEASQKMSSQQFDFLLEPIKSIFMLTHFSHHEWQNQIQKIFQTIQKEISDYVSAILGQKFQQISESLAKVNYLSKNIQQMSQGVFVDKWNLKYQKFYSDCLEDKLKQIHKIGKLNVFNYEGVSTQVDVIKKQIDRLTWGIWETESELRGSERMANFKNRMQMVFNTNESLSREEVHTRIQKIYKALKLKPFVLQQSSQALSIKCDLCGSIMISKLQNKQEKKAECFYFLLKHFYDVHKEAIIEKFIKKNNKTSYKLTYEEFLKEITVSRFKEYLIIDRENVNTENAVSTFGNGNEVYTLEVVSVLRQNLTTGRYMVADSAGKDAADILTIIVLYDICRLVGNSRVTLLTNDHFGKTMKPIFAAIGMKINLDNKFRAKQSKGQKEKPCIIQPESMMIEE